MEKFGVKYTSICYEKWGTHALFCSRHSHNFSKDETTLYIARATIKMPFKVRFLASHSKLWNQVPSLDPIWWFRILGIFSVENIKSLCVFMFQTCSNSQLLRRVLWISAEQTIGASLKHKNTQPLYIFSRVRVLHLNRLKERTWLHSFGFSSTYLCTKYKWKQCY